MIYFVLWNDYLIIASEIVFTSLIYFVDKPTYISK